MCSNKNRHSRTYQKGLGQRPCRFGAPWPSVNHPAIIRPLDGEDIPKMNYHRETYGQIQMFLKEMKPEECNITFEAFLWKLGITQHAHILTLLSSLQKTKVF